MCLSTFIFFKCRNLSVTQRNLIQKDARMKGEEFVTTQGKLIKKKVSGLDCNCKKIRTVMFIDEKKNTNN